MQISKQQNAFSISVVQYLWFVICIYFRERQTGVVWIQH